ncbi:MAG: proprotein convertase P-domain-containing protein [Myxococcales bacterium]|nr:proprotein convertase P-domain-containing protein [Myxococcales bacterium]
MRTTEGRLLLLVSLASPSLPGCSAGVIGDSGGLTFGPVGTASATNATSTTDDITTSGLGTRGDTSRPDDTSSDDAGTSSGAADGTTGPGSSGGPACGDGVADPGEDCDGADLAGLACPDVDPMFVGGVLACDPGCAFDTSGCTVMPESITQCQVVGAAIPDNSAVGVTDTIVLPPEVVGGTVVDVDVSVELDHTFIGDLFIDVTHGGTSVLLHDSCGSEENLDVTYDDEAGVAFDCSQSDLGLTVQPASPLSALDGAAVNANWTLFVEDQASIDTGILSQWCVTLTWM